MADAGINIFLGTDGYAADLTLPMKLVTAIFKDSRQDFRLFSAADALTMATLNAAHALQISDQTGSLELGKQADIVMHDTDRPEWKPMLNVLNQFVWSADGRGVHSVWVDGERLINNYQSTRIDEEAFYARVQTAGETIIKRSSVPLVSPWPIE